jgi:hypothetical protein
MGNTTINHICSKKSISWFRHVFYHMKHKTIVELFILLDHQTDKKAMDSMKQFSNQPTTIMINNEIRINII